MDINKTLFADIETHDANMIWDMPSEKFVRMLQYAWGFDGEVHIETDFSKMRDIIRSADRVVFHNGINFDLPAIFGKDSMEPLLMARDHKVFDTFVYASLHWPAPYSYTNRKGHTFYGASAPEKAKSWLSLDNLSYQFDLDGKEGDLKALAKKYGGFGQIPLDDPEFIAYAKQDIVALQDLTRVMLEQVTPGPYDWREMIVWSIFAQMTRNGFTVNQEWAKERVEELAVRKQELLEDLITRFGFPSEGKMPWRTNPGKEAVLRALAEFGITPENTPDWPKTKKNQPSLGGPALAEITEGTPAEEFGQTIAELSGQRPLAQKALDEMCLDGKVHPQITCLQRSGRTSVSNPGLTIWTSRGPGATEKRVFKASPGRVLREADFSNADARIVAAYSGDKNYAKKFDPGVDGHEITARMVYGDATYESDPKKYRQQAKACIAEGELVLTDHGLVPIENVTLAMKVWDGVDWVSHDGVIYKGAREIIQYDGLRATRDHQVFVYSESGQVEVPFERAYSERLRLVKTGVSSAEETSVEGDSVIALVYDIVNAGPRHRFTVSGNLVRNCSHGWGYGGGPAAIQRATGLPLETCDHFVKQMTALYPGVTTWRNACAISGQRGFIKNYWGRVMPVDPDNAYTQSSALLGQSGTRELMVDGLIRILNHNPEWIRYIVAIVHDALVFDLPEDIAEDLGNDMIDLMQTDFDPPRGQKIHFPMSVGPAARDWFEASHG